MIEMNATSEERQALEQQCEAHYLKINTDESYVKGDILNKIWHSVSCSETCDEINGKKHNYSTSTIFN